MKPRVPEKDKQPGVRYAVTDDGIELPIVDVGHPTFAIDVRSEDLPRIEEASIAAIRRATRLPRFIGEIIGCWSPILRGTLRASGGVLDGMTTYLYKLGPRNLGRGYTCAIDRDLNGRMGPAAARLRFHAFVQLSAEALDAVVARRPGGTIRIVNIGGGTGIDSLNALLVVRRERSDALSGRTVAIDVLDPDAAEPSFGARALEALRSAGGPLEGLDLSLRRRSHDWTGSEALRALLDRVEWAEAAICCSEGALFEYAPDETVLANLVVLHDRLPDDCPVLATAIRPARILQVWREVSGMPFQVRSEEQLASLVARDLLLPVLPGNAIAGLTRDGERRESTSSASGQRPTGRVGSRIGASGLRGERHVPRRCVAATPSVESVDARGNARPADRPPRGIAAGERRAIPPARHSREVGRTRRVESPGGLAGASRRRRGAPIGLGGARRALRRRDPGLRRRSAATREVC
jgi:hypothetical protein